MHEGVHGWCAEFSQASIHTNLAACRVVILIRLDEGLREFANRSRGQRGTWRDLAEKSILGRGKSDPSTPGLRMASRGAGDFDPQRLPKTQFGISPGCCLCSPQLTHLNLSEYYFCLA